MSDLIQWVNLPKESAFVEDDIKSVKRLGSIKFKGSFKTGDLANFKVRLIADGGNNIEYTAKEIARWKRYKQLPVALTAQLNDSKDEVLYDQEFELPAAGGNCYKVEARYKDKVVSSSKKIIAARKMFFEVIPMDGVNSPSKNDLESELKKVFDVSDIGIMCKETGERKNKISKIKTIISDDHFNQVDKELNSKLTSLDHKPYVVPIAFVDFIASYESIYIERDIKVALEKKLLSLKNDIVTVKFMDNDEKQRFLFYSFDDDFDKNKLWLEGGSRIEDENGKSIGVLSRENIVGQNLSEINFKVTPELSKFLTKKKGVIKLKVKVVDGITNGYAWKGCVIVALKRLTDLSGNRAYKSINDYMETIKHEFGHTFKQASTGDCSDPVAPGPDAVTFIDDSSPDSHVDLYGQYHEDCGAETNDYGHQGPHCKSGASYDIAKKRWNVNAGQDLCIMFGASGLGPRKSFCGNCKKTLRKVDIIKE